MLYKLHLVLNKVHHLTIAITKNSEVEIESRRIAVSLKSNGIFSRNLSLVNHELEELVLTTRFTTAIGVANNTVSAREVRGIDRNGLTIAHSNIHNIHANKTLTSFGCSSFSNFTVFDILRISLIPIHSNKILSSRGNLFRSGNTICSIFLLDKFLRKRSIICSIQIIDGLLYFLSCGINCTLLATKHK